MHPSSLAPEGGAPASWTVYPSLGECDRKRNPAQADSTRSTTLVLFLKGGTSLETGKHDSVGKVQDVHGESTTRAEAPIRLTTGAKAPWLAVG